MRISHENINNKKIYIRTPKKTERKKEKIIKSIARHTNCFLQKLNLEIKLLNSLLDTELAIKLETKY
jgi:hypothetical protein